VCAVFAHGSVRSNCYGISDMCLIKMRCDRPNLTESAMPRTRHQSHNTPSQPSCLPRDPSTAINQSHSAVVAKSRVGNKIVSNTKPQMQKKSVDAECRRSAMPRTRHQSQNTPSQPSCLPRDPSTAINQSHSAVVAKSRVGNKIVSNTKPQMQKKSVDAECRRSQRPTTQRNAAAAAVLAKEVAEQQAQMFAQYRERKTREEARLNAQHIGMLRYLRLCL
jgi:hypothetical protein